MDLTTEAGPAGKLSGSDEVDFGYCFGERAQEEPARPSGVPWTVVRATQFFEFPEPLLNSESPVNMVPRRPPRPVAAQDVARTLVEHAAEAPHPAGRPDTRSGGAAHRTVPRRRREVMPNLAYTFRRCHSTVCGLRNNWAPISELVSPSRARRAI